MNNNKILILLFMNFCLFYYNNSSAEQISDKEYRRLQTQYKSLLPSWITQYEKSIVGFEKQDKIIDNPKYDIVFIGSSTFGQWETMQEDFAPARVINRGFGGSTIREVIYYSDRILFPYQPKIVVLYVGNDVWGEPTEPSVEQLFDYFKLFEQNLHRKLPNARLNFISMRPSPAKKYILEKQNAINSLLNTFAKNTPNTHFIDIRSVMYDKAGKLKKDIFKSDKLHLNDKGNKLITNVIKPILIKQLQEVK